DVRRIQPRDECPRKSCLLGGLRKDRRTIAPSDVRSLPVDLRRVMSDGEIDLEELGVADLRRIVGDPDRLGMASAFRAHRIITGILRRAAGISGDDVGYAAHMLEDAFHAPEAAAREDGGFGS